MKANKTLMATLAIGSLLAFSQLTNAADTNAPAAGATPPATGAAGGRGGRMGPNIDQIAKDLNLTDDQKAKVQKVLDDRRQKMRELMQDQTVQGADRRAKMKTIQDDTDKQLKDAGLSQDQIDKLNKMMGPRQRMQRANPPGGDKAAPADKAQQ